MTHQVIHGDSLDVLPTLPTASVDAIVTDPPYGLNMRHWDHGCPGAVFWAHMRRVARPGAYLLAFGGTRTFHRLACAIEDAGWEIKDTIGWLYNNGLPKSQPVADTVAALRAERMPTLFDDMPDRPTDGLGTSLKPAWEPVIMARAPLVGTIAQTYEAHGTGVLHIDACRIPAPDGERVVMGAGIVSTSAAWDRPWKHDEQARAARAARALVAAQKANDLGRWPANILHDGSAEVHQVLNDNMRFFFSSKTSQAERGGDNDHVSVKPVALMRWLCRLVTPPGGVVLDPFAGSGSTGVAAVAEEFSSILIEREPEYAEIIRRRIAHAQGALFAEEEA